MTEKQPDQTYRDLMPIPWTVSFWVSVITHPIAASLVLGIPYGIAIFALATFGVVPVSPLSPALAGIIGWLGGAFVMDLMLRRPY